MKKVTITETAKKYLTEVSKEKNCRIRYSLDGGGCAGYRHKWSYEKNVSDGDYILDLREGRELIIDSHTMELLKHDTIIDYVKDDFFNTLNVKIPNTVGCGCGESVTFEG